MPKPVIFIHGVAGSRLVDGPPGGDELWLGPLSDRRRLNLFPNGDPPPSPNIRAVGVLRDVTIFGHPVKQIYGPLLDFLTTTGGYIDYLLPANGDPTCDTDQISPDPTLNPNLFEFVYDWRQELGSTAQQLRTFVECVEQFHPGSKINVLTHSMGSVLARRYILDNPTDHNVERLITIGAPPGLARRSSCTRWRKANSFRALRRALIEGTSCRRCQRRINCCRASPIKN